MLHNSLRRSLVDIALSGAALRSLTLPDSEVSTARMRGARAGRRSFDRPSSMRLANASCAHVLGKQPRQELSLFAVPRFSLVGTSDPQLLTTIVRCRSLEIRKLLDWLKSAKLEEVGHLLAHGPAKRP